MFQSIHDTLTRLEHIVDPSLVDPENRGQSVYELQSRLENVVEGLQRGAEEPNYQGVVDDLLRLVNIPKWKKYSFHELPKDIHDSSEHLIQKFHVHIQDLDKLTEQFERNKTNTRYGRFVAAPESLFIIQDGKNQSHVECHIRFKMPFLHGDDFVTTSEEFFKHERDNPGLFYVPMDYFIVHEHAPGAALPEGPLRDATPVTPDSELPTGPPSSSPVVTGIRNTPAPLRRARAHNNALGDESPEDPLMRV